MQPDSSRIAVGSKLTPALSLLLGLITVVIYWGGLHGGYIFDDQPNLVDSATWKLTSLDAASLRNALFSNGSGVSGRPLAMLSFGLNHYFSGMAPFPYKLTNLALHLLNGGLVYLLVVRLLALAQGATPPASGYPIGRATALLIAAIWMLHPLQVSTVLYVVQRMEIGACTGTLIALLAYLRARQAQMAGEPTWSWWILAAVAAAIGLGFKETAIVIPGYTLLLELSLLRFKIKGNIRSTPLVASYGLLVASALVAFLAFVLPHAIQSSAYATRDFSVGERLLTQLRILPMYLEWYLLPAPSKFVFYYDNYAISTDLLHPLTTLAGACLLVGLATAAFVLRRRWPLFTLGVGWFFIAHSLTSNVIPLELVFEHRNYFALLAILLALAQPAATLFRRFEPRSQMLVSVALTALVAGLCVVQVNVWANPVNQAVFFSTHNPTSERAAYQLGLLYWQLANGDPASQNWRNAEQAFARAAAIPGSSVLGLNGMIMMHASDPASVDAATWSGYRTKLIGRSIDAQGISSIAQIVTCRIKEECHFDDNELFKTLLAVFNANPSSAVVATQYASFAFSVMHDEELGLELAKKAAQLEPNSLQYQANLGVFYALSGDKEEAAKILRALKQKDLRERYKETWGKLELLLQENE